jgi:hypothetical protein
MAERGEAPAYVMWQIGHRNARLTLEVYTDVRDRKRETGGLGDLLSPAPSAG